jgi:exodeoxyribonuclease V alpha subunit
VKHIAVRMAWHDNGWDGTVCRDPAANSYCTGSHSLLSERLARNRRLDMEQEMAKEGKQLDAALPDYLPPCYWTSCAFAPGKTTIVHRHPFKQYQDTKRISGTLKRGSVFTWPFRLSMAHTQAAVNKHGKYFADLDARIDRYRKSLSLNASLIFFYLNYDNPISADEYKYALVGCARLEEAELTGHFPFDQQELKRIRAGDGMKNFPTLNWALQLTHQGTESVVRLPYQEYVA